jgi:hypothetical protein
MIQSSPPFADSKHPALVMVSVAVAETVATFCHFANDPVPALVTVPEMCAVA